MARHTEPTEKNEADWLAWVASRPDLIREMVERHGFDPWTLYRLDMKDGRFQRVVIASFYGPGARRNCRTEEVFDCATVSVAVLGAFNAVGVERRVGPLHPDDLTPCGPPLPTDLVGCGNLTPKDVRHLFELRDRGLDDQADAYLFEHATPPRPYGDPNLQ